MRTTHPSFSVHKLALQSASLDHEIRGLIVMDMTDHLGLPGGLLYKWSCPVSYWEACITLLDGR